MRRFLVIALLAGLFASGSASAHPNTPSQLEQRLARAIVVPGVRTAALALDLRTGRQVFARGAGWSLAPASNEKVLVAYAALELLGPGYRIPTHVLGRGERAGRVWRGDLVLRGFGDPTLGLGRVRALAARLHARGIRRVTGSILGDESFFDTRRTAPGWKPGYYLEECPALSALTVDRGWLGTRSSHDPALSAARSFRRALAEQGIAVAGRARVGHAEGVTLAATLSPPLWKILRRMGRKSDNFYAETLLKHLGSRFGGAGTTAAGATAVAKLLKARGVPLAGVRIADGSGLSLLNRLTPSALAAIFSLAWNDRAVREHFLETLPVAGRNGTLEDRLRNWPARGHVRAKTGTTRRASSLAGFVGRRYVFAVLQNAPTIPYWAVRRSQDRFATLLAGA